MKSTNVLLKERGRLTRKLLRFREMLPGSFSERKITCGKSNCACIRKGKLHTAYQFTYRSGGKTKNKMIPAQKVDEVRKRVALNKEFKELVARIHEINIAMLLDELTR